MPKIERSTSVTSTPRAQVVSRASVTVPAAPKGSVTEYAGQAAPAKELVPRGANLSKSASPAALWGEAPKQVELDPAAFAALPPAEQQQVVEAAKVEHAQLGGEIVERVEVLDRRWNHSRLSTRTEALREYHEHSGRRLDGRTRRKLDGLVVRSEESQRRINELRVKIDALPKTPESKKAQVELRTQLARELRRARDEQSKAVKEATAVVDAAGLKVDRLAVTEQIIDPSAPAQGSGGSLLDKIVRFFKLEWFFDSIGKTLESATQTFAQQVQKRGEKIAEESKAKLDDLRTREQQQSAQVQAEVVGKSDAIQADVLARARAAMK